MQDLEKMGTALFGGQKGKDLRTLMESDAGRALEQKLDAAAVEKAARSGDAAALQGILTQVLSTEEGRALAEQLSKMGF